MKWRGTQELIRAARGERHAILEAERKAERVFVEEIVSVLCALSDSGLADCSDLKASCSVRGWGRTERFICFTIKCSANRPGACRTFNWRHRRV